MRDQVAALSPSQACRTAALLGAEGPPSLTVGYLTQHSLQKSPRRHILDPHFAGLLAHACEPNVVLDMDRQNLHALRPIQLGDVLTIDYG